jgi:hypothetical protein
MTNTLPAHSKYQLQDEKSNFFQRKNEYSESMPDIYDIPITVVNNILYYQRSARDKYDASFRQDIDSPPSTLRSLSGAAES